MRSRPFGVIRLEDTWAISPIESRGTMTEVMLTIGDLKLLTEPSVGLAAEATFGRVRVPLDHPIGRWEAIRRIRYGMRSAAPYRTCLHRTSSKALAIDLPRGDGIE